MRTPKKMKKKISVRLKSRNLSFLDKLTSHQNIYDLFMSLSTVFGTGYFFPAKQVSVPAYLPFLTPRLQEKFQ